MNELNAEPQSTSILKPPRLQRGLQTQLPKLKRHCNPHDDFQTVILDYIRSD
jgi:hypothetical protein